MPLDDLLETIAAETRIPFIAARPGDLKDLRDLGAPLWLVDFYASHEPESTGSVIFTIDEIASATRHTFPGSEAFPLGYLPIADTSGGDQYVVDLRASEQRILLLSHESSLGETREQVESGTEAVSTSFEEFLRERANGSL